MVSDEERASAKVHYVPGFGSLADFIASDIDHSTAVYRRFDKLAERDLLYYQSELLELAALQDDYDREDALDIKRTGNDGSSDSWYQIRENAQNWTSFKRNAENATSGDGRWRKRMDLAIKIRKTLEDYQKALLRHSTLLSLESPSKQTMNALSHSFHQRVPLSMSSDHQITTLSTLTGASADLYPPPPTLSHSSLATDHVSLSHQPHSDLLTKFLKTYCSSLFRSQSPPRSSPPPPNSLSPSHLPPPQLTHYSLHLLNLTASFITTFLAALLLFLPIYVLYHVSPSQPGLKLGLIALFTALFAGTVALVSNARRAEIFGACAAYAAVLVVFVSEGLGGQNCG